VAAHNLPAGEFGSAGYDRALLADSGYRAVFQSPNIEAAVEPPNTKRLDHLLLLQVKNWLNGFQFSYKARPEDLHVVVATYASANLLSYGDAVWQKYRLGEKCRILESRRSKSGALSSSPDTRPWMATPGRRWQTVGHPRA
jgi:hypothetical protein